jgi:hypothetical protein
MLNLRDAAPTASPCATPPALERDDATVYVRPVGIIKMKVDDEHGV